MKKCLSKPKIGRKGETQEGKIEDKQKPRWLKHTNKMTTVRIDKTHDLNICCLQEYLFKFR